MAVECIFTWYWGADVCAREGIPFVLGHALYMKAIHGGKVKNDKIDAHEIAVLLRGGMLPMASGSPRAMRATRDLLRRRCNFMRKRAELITHIQNTATEYVLPAFGKKLVKCGKESDGKPYGYSGAKIGTAHLKWAFSEAPVLSLRQNPPAQRFVARLTQQHGKAKALTILPHKLARAVYYMLRRGQVFDATRFFAGTATPAPPPGRAPLEPGAPRGQATPGAQRGARIPRPTQRPRRRHSPGVVTMATTSD